MWLCRRRGGNGREGNGGGKCQRSEGRVKGERGKTVVRSAGADGGLELGEKGEGEAELWPLAAVGVAGLP